MSHCDAKNLPCSADRCGRGIVSRPSINHIFGCCWYSRRITGTLEAGMAPNSVTMTDT